MGTELSSTGDTDGDGGRAGNQSDAGLKGSEKPGRSPSAARKSSSPREGPGRGGKAEIKKTSGGMMEVR